MDRLLVVLQDRRFRSLITLGFIGTIIWFGGPYIAIAGQTFLENTNIRLLILLMLALFWGVNNLRYSIKPNSKKESLAVTTSSDYLKSEAVLMEEHLTLVNDAIKNMLPNKSALPKKLPALLVIGAEKSGKSSLFAAFDNSSTLRPLISDKYGNWWLIANTLFFESTSVLSTSDRNLLPTPSLSQLLLKSFKEKQRFAELKGIVLTINLSQWFNKSKTQQQDEVQKVIEQIKIASHYFNKLSVTLILTQSDLISGFSEYFSNLSNNERNQMLGFELPTYSTQQEYKDAFANTLNNFIKSLNNHVVVRMHQELQQQTRERIKDFPLQLQLLQPVIMDILLQVASLSVTLKGCYFTSSLQQGVANDYVAKSVRSSFELQIPLATQTTKGIHYKQFFIQNLLSQLIPDQKQFSSINVSKKIIFSSLIISAIIIGLFSFDWFYSYQQNQRVLFTLQTALLSADHLIDTKPNTSNPYPNLNSMNALSSALLQLQHDNHLGFIKTGFYQSNQIATHAQQSYRQLLINQFAPALQKNLENQLKQNNPDPSSLYQALKTYLMLTSTDHRDSALIKAWFNQYWQQMYPNDVALQQQLLQHLTALLQQPAFTMHENTTIVTQARNELSQIPLAQLSYSVLLDHNNYQTLPIFSRPSAQFFLANNVNIPLLYTTNKLNEIYNVEIPAVCKEVSSGNWVLGKQQSEITNDLVSQVQQLYLTQYAQTWKSALNNISVANVTNLEQAENLTKLLGNSHSPVSEILIAVKTNTAANANIPQFNQLVSSQFTNFQTINNNTLQQLQKAFSNTSSLLDKINDSSNPTQASFSFSAARMESNAQADEITNLEQQITLLPQPAQSWLTTIPANTWHLLLNDSQTYLNTVWTKTVLPQYNQNLSNRYPLFRNATGSTSLADFSAFFEPRGTIDNFFNQYLKPFVDTSNYYWVWRTVDNQQINIPQTTLEMFIRASLIQRMFFPDGSDKLQTQFTLVPLALEPGVNSFSLNLEGQPVTYQAGVPQTASLIWPGPTPGIINMQFVDDSGRQASFSAEGPWAFFKLLDNANLEKSQDPRQYRVTFDLNGNSVQYALHASDLVNPFIVGITDAFRCPATL